MIIGEVFMVVMDLLVGGRNRTMSLRLRASTRVG